jgi:UDP-N-acetylmuramyl pentapeptide phosphotransferase/UDP-N-acetylglucosamine-1-phosphate transferase
LVAAAAITPTTVRGLATRTNYRGAQVACPTGIAIPLAALIALIAVGPLYEFASEDVLPSGFGVAVLFVFGVAVLGLIDDVFGSAEGQPRGWRGHFGALGRGQLSTGVLKALGVLGLALLVANYVSFREEAADYLLAAAVLVLATNVFNLVDLRPGRAIKAFVLLGVALCAISGQIEPLQSVGLFVGPILFLLPFDLREVGMLGDAGSNVIGAVAGVWLILTLTTTLGLAIAAGVLALITIYGEFRSISGFIERTPGFRQLDLLGRSHA